MVPVSPKKTFPKYKIKPGTFLSAAEYTNHYTIVAPSYKKKKKNKSGTGSENRWHKENECCKNKANTE